MSRLLPPLLALAYLALAHAAASTGQPTLALAAAALLLLLILGPGLQRGASAAWLGLLAGAALLAWLQQRELAALPLYAPPVLLNLFMAWLFGHTLAPGSRPLIERLVRLLDAPAEPLDPALLRYARGLTVCWTTLFLLLALLNLGLALCAVPGGLLQSFGVTPPLAVPQATWSLCANLLNYLVVAAFFVLEYGWRCQRFGSALPDRSFAAFVQRLARLGPGWWRGLLQ